jgi:hypothetical protein
LVLPNGLKGENTASKGLIGHTAVLNALVVAGKEVLIPWGIIEDMIWHMFSMRKLF